MEKKYKLLVASATLENEPEAIKVMEDAGFDLKVIPIDQRKDWTEEDIIRELKSCDGLVAGADFEITRSVIINSPSLKAISLNCTGYNHVDIKAASEKGIPVFNTPGLSFNAVADFIIGQILALMRKIVLGDKRIRSGLWNKDCEKSTAVSGKTMGIIGLGSIGLAVVKRAKAFDMVVMANVRNPKPEYEEKYGFKYVSKEKIFTDSDILVLCCPLSDETYHLVNAQTIGMMKKNAVIINPSRGPVIDSEALYQALVEGRIQGAALDVFDIEPTYESKFFELENTVLTPHLAGLADEQITACAVAAAQNIRAFFFGGEPSNVINREVYKGGIFNG